MYAGNKDQSDVVKGLGLIAMITTSIASTLIILNFFGSGAAKEKQSQNQKEIVVVKEIVIEKESKQSMVRLLMHREDHYSVFVMNSETNKKLEQLEFSSRNWFSTFDIYCDVPDGEPMWFIAHGSKRDWSRKVEFHIHSPKDINGGGWDKGKHGKGQTNVIE